MIVPKRKTRENLLSSSDWIIFLQGEISFSLSFLFPLYSAILIMYIALIQINQSVGSDLFPTDLGGITAALFFLIFAPAVIVAWDIRPVRKLLKKIMKGELKNHEEILVEYEKIEKRNIFHIQKKSK